MRKVDEITIPKNSKVELKSGSLHIMLIRLVKELKLNDEIKTQLYFANGSQKEVTALVKPRAKITKTLRKAIAKD
jgi:copper(I)-binding protein